RDMAGAGPMNRLLQGDVGSGKTVVALSAALLSVQSGHQAAIMAPTEILAAQHLRTVAALLAPLGGRELDPSPTPSSHRDDQPSLLEPDETPSPSDGPAVTFALLSASAGGRERARGLAGG